MFEQIITMFEIDRERKACEIIKKHIQMIMDDDTFFVAKAIEKDVNAVLEGNVTEDHLIDLFESLLAFRTKCRSFLRRLEVETDGKVDEYFEDFLRENKLKDIGKESKSKLKKLVKTIKKNKS